MILPLLWLGIRMRGDVKRPAEASNGTIPVTKYQRTIVFALGLLTLLGVPVFKALTHLPPFMGVMFGLGILWCYTELIHSHKMEERGQLTVTAIPQRIDHSSILFFLGILVAVAGLETSGHLTMLSEKLSAALPDVYMQNTVIGLLSAVVDNVPLVAAAQGMYPLTTYAQDHAFWELLALCAGTGGSILIIGSAAGVAVMGVMGIDFVWYVRRMLVPACIGYAGGIITYWSMWA
jgi:Na+/H+ antiporter NhaD/arsenite permease-like protein